MSDPTAFDPKPFVMRVNPDLVVGDKAGDLIGEIIVIIAETHGRDAAIAFVRGGLACLVAGASAIIGDQAALDLFEDAVALARFRVEHGSVAEPMH